MKTLEQLGEFEFINAVARQCAGRDASILRGIGDDAAVVEVREKASLLFTADMLIENVHFLRTQPARWIGHKALACSISDIAAMGGIPRYCLISVAFPSDMHVSFARDIYQGMCKTARLFDISIIGGDTNCADKIIIDVFLCGTVKTGRYITRSGARAGDLIFVTGCLGGSQAGRHLRFVPRVRESRFLASHFPINSMIDISDGLVSDLGHILEQSKKSAVLRKEAIPLSLHAASLEDAFYTGEDFELLFTLPRKYEQQLVLKWPFKKKVRLTCIGEIVKGKAEIFIKDKYGNLNKAEKGGGYQHFRWLL